MRTANCDDPHYVRDVAKLKELQTSKKKNGSGWVGPGPFWIENRKLKNQEKLKSLMFIGSPPKKKMDRGVSGWDELYPNLFWMSGNVLTLQGP